MPVRKNREKRRLATRHEAKLILEGVVSRAMDAYEGYRQLYGIWCSNNAAVQELRPLFRIPGYEPDGILRVDDSFRQTVRSTAAAILEGRSFEEDSVSN